MGGVCGTQEQTLGELSKTVPATHDTLSMHEQIPPQSAPPAFGSQLSLGSSTHLPRPGQGKPAMPPQPTLGPPGGGLHVQVGQPSASSTLPYAQKMSHTGPHVCGLAFTQVQTDGVLSKTVP